MPDLFPIPALNQLIEQKFPEAAVQLPGLDPSDRTARASNGHRSTKGPGLLAGTTAEWREGIATFDSNRVVGTRNTCIFRGWNYLIGGGQIDPAQGSVGSGEENAFQPSSPAETWSEAHPFTFTPPGGSIRRPISGYGVWETGFTSVGFSATSGLLQLQPLVGSSVNLIYWSGTSSISVAGNGFYHSVNGDKFYHQMNGAGTAFIDLPYCEGSEVVLGNDPVVAAIPITRAKGIRFLPTAAGNIPNPADGKTLFLDSATNLISTKDSAGTVSAV